MSKLLAARLQQQETVKIEELNSEELSELQTLLKERGFDPGPIDGIFGEKTSRAFDEFKESEFMAHMGILGRGSLSVLAKGEAVSPRAKLETLAATASVENPDAIDFTGPNSNPQSTPESPDKLPPKPPEPKRFRVPGISAEINSNSPIFFNGKATNFTWGEATKLGERIPVSVAITSNIIKLAGYMDEVREFLGDRPIGVTSWYRDPVTNAKIGGAIHSQHLVGNAVDFYVVGEDVVTTFNKLKRFHNWGGLAVGNGFVHLDMRPGATARWTYPGGPRVSLW